LVAAVRQRSGSRSTKPLKRSQPPRNPR
jgi:hypothetical protein